MEEERKLTGKTLHELRWCAQDRTAADNSLTSYAPAGAKMIKLKFGQ